MHDMVKCTTGVSVTEGLCYKDELLNRIKPPKKMALPIPAGYCGGVNKSIERRKIIKPLSADLPPMPLTPLYEAWPLTIPDPFPNSSAEPNLKCI